MRNFTSNVWGGIVGSFSGALRSGKLKSGTTLFALLLAMTSASAQTTAISGGNITASNIGPSIVHSNPVVSSAIQSFKLVQTSSDNLAAVSFTTSGTYTTTDVTNFSLYVNTLANSIDGASLVPSSTISASGPGTQTISLSSVYSLSSSTPVYYFFIVPTFGSTPVSGHTIAVAGLTSGNISVSAGSVSGSAAASGTLTIINPTITATTGASRCSTGVVTLNATPSTSASVNWFAASSGGSSLASGTNFVTPSISSTTTYYAEAGQAATLQLGTLTDYSGIMGDYQMDSRTDLNFFSSTYACTINSVDVYPSSIGNMVITMTNSSGTILASTTVNITAADTSISVPKTISLGFSVPAGATNYRLGGDASFNASEAHLYRGNINGTGTYGPYPATVNGFSYTGDAASGGGFTGLGSRCYFYNWNVTFPYVPATSRNGVTATINPVPTSVTATATPNPVCNNSTLTLTGTATGASTYAWNSPGGTALGSSTSLSTSVTGVVPGNAGVYTLTATTASGCSTTATTAAVTVNALPTPTFTAAPGATTCPSVNVTYTTQSGQSNYTWTIPGVSGTDYSVVSGGTSSSNTLTLQWLSSGSKTLTVNYSTSGCAGATAASNTTTVNAAPNVSNFSVPSVSLGCSGSLVTVTVNSTSLGSGTFNVTYNLSGANSATNNVATMTFSGTSGTFSTNALANSGSTTITITSVTNANGCTTPVSSGNTNTFTVNAGVAPITGTLVICNGSSTTLSDVTSGGTWSSTNTGVATIGSATGTVNSVAAGSTTISYTVSSGCAATALFAVGSTSPTIYSVTGGGSYCAGGTGVHIGLNSSANGNQYKLFDGSTLMATVSGTGSALDFGLFTASGTYTVVVNSGASCGATMSGSATVSVNPLPTAFSVGGGGTYCAGGSGVSITLSSSTIGVNYQLMQGATTVGSLVVGTSGSLSFGPVTSVGTYTITATDGTTACTNSMSGSATVTTNPIPAIFSVTGGGGYCLGSTGVHVGLSGSASGVNYQLLVGGSPTGSAVSGTGSALDFGLVTTAATYTVLATDAITACTVNMSGSAVVSVNPLPTSFTVSATNGGAYCSGGTGQTINLSSSQSGVDYQLVQGTSYIGAPVAGTGAGLSFGSQIAPGSYTVFATNSSTGCTATMSGSVSISILPLPTAFSVTGGGGYCASGTGVAVGLSGSVTGITYNLFNGTTLVGAASGTGSTVSFGSQLVPGMYTVTAINATTTCSVSMAGSVNVSINPLPAPFTVTGGGVYCAGGTGVAVGLGGSVTGINYQLFNGITAVGAPLPGNGLSLNFGLQTGTGSYTVVGTDAVTGCKSSMSGGVLISTNPLPVAYTVTGGGSYCSGGSGEAVGLSASDVNVNYQLWDGTGTAIGGLVPGTGSAITFGTFTTTSTVTYTVTATDGTTGCQNNMSGSATVTVLPLPNVYAMIGGGNYCAGGTGVSVGLASSDLGVNYQLYNGATPVGGPVGSVSAGSPITFGLQTVAGTYTVIATDGTTLCSNNMSGAEVVGINPLPAVYPVTGGGNYCSGGTGVAVGLGNSAPGISYQLQRGGTNVGAAVPGSGTAITFGAQTIAGTYSVVATSGASCQSNMTGTVTVNILPLPAVYATTGGGNYCSGGTGVHVRLSGSTVATSYQLYANGTPSGAPLPGSTLALDFGLHTVAGTYKVVATNTSTGCFDSMSGSATILVNPLPTVYNVINGGTYCPGGTGVDVSIDNSDIGTNYQLYRGATAIGLPVAGIGGVLSFGSQTAIGSYTVKAISDSSCMSNMAGSGTVSTYPLPTVYNVTGGGNYCSGGTGSVVGLNSSDVGISYQLMNSGGVVGGPVTGTGLALSFGQQTSADVYTVVATNTVTGCSDNMSGSATVGINPLPVSYSVTGGGTYCTGGAGLPIGISGSDHGIAYQLFIGTTATGTPIPGTGSAIDFGLKTVAGTYSVMGINVLTGCVNEMGGTEDIIVNPLPTQYALSGGGNYCSGSGGLELILGGSDFGAGYQLYNGTTPVGAPVPGTGSTISLGFQTAAGTYTVVATDGSTFCSNNMTSPQTIAILPLPTAYTITGGGGYCARGAGVHVKLSGSNTGISYQLQVNGANSGTPMVGTGAVLDFGLQTAGGNYTVIATNAVTGCTNIMTGSVNVTVNPLPTVYSVFSDSSNYCAGGAGVHIWLNTSDVGINYQLMIGSVPSRSPVAGTGSTVDFGFAFTPGLYRVAAIDAVTGCTDSMRNAVTVAIVPLPTAYAVTGGGAYCTGSAGVNVGLGGSNSGVSYQLMNGATAVGSPITGTGSAISFGPQTAGNYTVVATNIATNCTNTMSGVASVIVTPIPSVYAVTGTGNYCAGSTGADVGVASSDAGVDYQLYNGSGPVGSPVAGTGAALDFGPQTAGTYTVVAANALSGCTSNMAGSAVIGLNPAPGRHAVTGGGSYCVGGSGVHVNLISSDAGINYALMNGGIAVVHTAGTGTGIDFGLQTASGTYTVLATDATTGCTATMPGSVTVIVNPLPTPYNVVGGGNYCAGGAGVRVGLSNSASGVNYTLYNGSALATMAGSGTPVDFGLQTATGTYWVLATNATTGCSDSMAGTTTVGVNPVVIPSVTIANGSDTICDGTVVIFTAVGTNTGGSPLYQWTVNGTSMGVGNTYNYMPVNGDVIGVTLTSSNACASPMTASHSVTMAVDPNASPSVSVMANPGIVVCQGTSVTYSATPTYGGSLPSYTWVVNGNNVGTTNTYTYVPADHDQVYVLLTSNYHCALTGTATSGVINMEVDTARPPIITITSNPGTSVQAGQLETLTASVAHGGPTPAYQWYINGSIVSGATLPVFASSSLANNDSVTLQVISSGGCPGILGFNSVRIHVYELAVNQLSGSTSNIRLIPNPNNGAFSVTGNLAAIGDQDVLVEITNMAGQTVYKTAVQAHNGTLNEHIALDNSIANGMYILSVHADDDRKLFHLVVER